jgi:hypothetical protein
MVVGHSNVFGDAEVWRPVAAMHVTSLDLTSHGLDRKFSTYNHGLPWNNNLVSKTPVLKSYVNMTNRFYTESVEHPILSAGALGPERIWFSPAGVQVPLTNDGFRRFVSAVERQKRLCLVISDRNQRFRGPEDTPPPDLQAENGGKMGELRPARSVPVELLEYSPNRLIFDAVAPGDGWLLVTDRWAPGWQATVNGENVDVWIGNFVFRAVPVHQGSNHIAMTYRPFGYPWLLLLSWTSLAVVLAATIAVPMAKKGGRAAASQAKGTASPPEA